MISVIIINWNGKEHLEGCLASLRKQTLTDFEIILVDNGSTDGSVEYVRQVFPEVGIVALPENLGFCGGNNAGLRHARGELVALLNNDTEVSPHWLQALNGAAVKWPKAGLFASKMLFFDQRERLDTAGDEFHIAGFPIKRGWRQLDGPEFNQPREIFGACAGAALYRKEMLDRIGGLDEDFFVYAEDIDLSFRAQIYGYRCRYVPEAIVYHKGSATMGKTWRWFYLSRRNQLWVMVKNMPGKLLVKYLPVLGLYHLSSILYHGLRGRGRLILNAYWDAWRGLPKMLQKRHIIQASRTVPIKYLDSILARGGLFSRARSPVTEQLASSTYMNPP